MVELVCRNAKLAFELDVREGGRLTSSRLEALADLLELPEVPIRIEAFDISNIQGTDIVASMVVFERGHPSRSDYRKFKVRSVTGKPDDFASMHEVVLRHYRRVLEAKYVDGCSTRDLADRACVSEKAAESLLGRARKAFRARL